MAKSSPPPMQAPKEPNIKLPKGLHRMYCWDKFSEGMFWFMAGLVFTKGMYLEDAADEYRKFLQLDEDSAPKRAMVRKFQRQLVQFKTAVSQDRDMIKIVDKELIIRNGVQPKNGRSNSRSPGKR